MEYQFTKHYTLAEARALVPQVRQWLAQLQAVMQWFNQCEKRLQGRRQDGSDLGGETVNQWAKAIVEIAGIFAEFHAREIQIKDVDRGLVDFPSLMNGREVFLCWEQDEEDIQFWHDLDSGYAGRERLGE